jgi:hypothetical protein
MRQPSPRDQALESAIRAAAAADESQVVPFFIAPTDKLPTVKLAAKRVAARLDLPVNVGSNRAYPGAVLLSRGRLRGGRSRRST